MFKRKVKSNASVENPDPTNKELNAMIENTKMRKKVSLKAITKIVIRNTSR